MTPPDDDDARRTTVLIVEDHMPEVNLLSHRLQRWGYLPCGAASSGEEAVEKAISLQPDLVLVDIKLQGRMDGIEAAQIIRARCHIPCIFVTAHDAECTLSRARISEAYGYLLKPFSDRELHSAIEIALYKHHMERALQEKQSWLATTLRSIGDALVATDTRGLVQFMNPVAESLTGWRQSEALGRPLPEVYRILSEAGRRSIDSPVEIVLRTGVGVGRSNSTVLVAKDGREFPVENSASPMKSETGELIGAVLVFRDVTERRRATMALKKSEEHYRLLFERNLAGVFKATLDGRMLDCNDAFAAMMGFASRQDAVAAGEISWFPMKEDRNRFLEKVASLRFIVNEEIRLIRQDGTHFWALQNAGLIDDADLGGVIQGTLLDITDRKKMEFELRSAKEKAEQSDKLKAAILANMSHELRTPLNIVLGYAGVIRTFMSDRIKDEEQDLFAQLECGAKRLTRTVENVINISKVQAGMYNFQREILDLAAEIGMIAEEILPIAEQKGLRLTISRSEPVYVVADRYSIDQAFINILDNAVKFTRQGEVCVDISREGDKACVGIRDTGIGICGEYLGSIFNEFMQENSGFTRQFDGLGLGLPLTKRYIEGNGGSIAIESAKSMGTSVSVRLPLADLTGAAPVYSPAEQLLPLAR